MDKPFVSGRRLDQVLDELSDRLDIGEQVPLDRPVYAAHSDSRRIGPNDVFIALPGIRSQGLDYLDAAFEAGALAALVPSEPKLASVHQARCITSSNIRKDAALLACAVYRHPTQALLCFGVTGTNGKTSTCHLLAHMLEHDGHRVVLVTTVAHRFEDWQEDTPNTTPDAALLQSVLARAANAHATAAVIEVSAHALALERVGGCRFDGVAFTNLAPDHQDFFDGMEPYFQAKRRLFVEPEFHKQNTVAAIGCDDQYGRRLLDETRLPATGFGLQASNHKPFVDGSSLAFDQQGMSSRLHVDDLEFIVRTSLTGSFNRSNLAGAVALAHAAGVSEAALSSALREPIHVPGRLMSVESAAPFRVIVDFAHTASALTNLLDGLRGDTRGRLMVLFGAGGDKDPARRQTLPQAAFERSDVSVITLDNPRSEDPDRIIAAMVKHWQKLEQKFPARAPELHIEPDRRVAIGWLLSQAREGDTVVFAGKGHENTQEFADRIVRHDDSEIARDWLNAQGY